MRTVAATPQHAAIYCRISRDGVGAGLGVERQEHDIRQLAERLGWAIGPEHVFVDNDLSAYRKKVVRPGYEALKLAIKGGRVDGLLVWHTDRLHRRNLQLESFIDLLDANPIPVQTVAAGILDLASASGKMTARIVGAVAEHESEHKAERQIAKHAELTRDGRPVFGPRPFGLTSIKRDEHGRGYCDVVEEEAALIRKAAADVLAGVSVRQICRDLNASGRRPTGGAPYWSNRRITSILKSDYVVGTR